MKGKKGVGVIGIVVIFVCIALLYIFFLAPILNQAAYQETVVNGGSGISGFLFGNINFIFGMLLIICFIAIMGYFKG